MSVSAFPHGVIAAYGTPPALDTTVTLGTLVDLVSTGGHPSTVYYNAYGYDGGEDYYSYATNKGSIADDLYDDGTPTEQQVAAIYWTDGTEFTMFSLVGTSIANTDNTFREIVVRDKSYLRSAATYVASRNGGTHWYWSDATNPWQSTSGTRAFKVLL